METIDHFALIAERSNLLVRYIKDEITKEEFDAEFDRINNLLDGTP